MSFSAVQVVVVVRSELDSFTAPEVGTVLGRTGDRGHRSVLDLAECDFIDPAGLRVIAESAEHLALWGRTLSVRSPSSVVRRLLDLVGPATVALLEGPDAVRVTRLDFLRSIDAGRVAVAVTSLIPVTARQEALPPGSVDQEAVDSSWRLVVALAWALVGGADGASV